MKNIVVLLLIAVFSMVVSGGPPVDTKVFTPDKVEKVYSIEKTQMEQAVPVNQTFLTYEEVGISPGLITIENGTLNQNQLIDTYAYVAENRNSSNKYPLYRKANQENLLRCDNLLETGKVIYKLYNHPLLC